MKTQLYPTICLTALFAVVSLSYGQGSLPSELERLKQGHRAAIKKANAPLNERYVADLRRLLSKEMQTSSLDSIRAIVDEIESITGEKEQALIATGSTKELEKLVVGRTWRMVAGSEYTFKKDGEGSRKEGAGTTAFLWRASSPNTIEVTGKLGTGGVFRTFYFKLVSMEEAYYGDSPTSTPLPLTLARR